MFADDPRAEAEGATAKTGRTARQTSKRREKVCSLTSAEALKLFGFQTKCRIIRTKGDFSLGSTVRPEEVSDELSLEMV